MQEKEDIEQIKIAKNETPEEIKKENRNLNEEKAKTKETIKQIKKQQVLTKSDIMEQFHCESDKALRILKMMFQMGYGNKIGKEYYVSLNSQLDFLDKMRGKEVFI